MKNFIKDIRKAKKITLVDLAEMTGIAQSSLCDIQNGKQEPSVSNAYRISRALDKTVYKVFPEDSE